MFATALRLAAPRTACGIVAGVGRRGAMLATVAAFCGPSRSDLLGAVEQERTRVEVRRFAGKFPLLGDLAPDLSVKFRSSMDLLDTPYFAKHAYWWSWDKDWASRRETMLLDVLKLVCGAAENEADLSASARLLEFYGVPR